MKSDVSVERNIGMVKVSSITYVKNGEKYIEQCIRSVMGQTLEEIEIIVVDGESPDATPERVRESGFLHAQEA